MMGAAGISTFAECCCIQADAPHVVALPLSLTDTKHCPCQVLSSSACACCFGRRIPNKFVWKLTTTQYRVFVATNAKSSLWYLVGIVQRRPASGGHGEGDPSEGPLAGMEPEYEAARAAAAAAAPWAGASRRATARRTGV